MPSPGTDPETLLTRTTAVSLALQALVERLLLNGVLTADGHLAPLHVDQQPEPEASVKSILGGHNSLLALTLC